MDGVRNIYNRSGDALARNDPGSDALKAIMIGNIVFHVLALWFVIYHYRIGVMKLSGLVTGLLPYTLLIIGFVYFITRL